MASLAAGSMWKQSDRESGVPVSDGQEEGIPGQRPDLNNAPFRGSRDVREIVRSDY